MEKKIKYYNFTTPEIRKHLKANGYGEERFDLGNIINWANQDSIDNIYHVDSYEDDSKYRLQIVGKFYQYQDITYKYLYSFMGVLAHNRNIAMVDTHNGDIKIVVTVTINK